VSAGEGRGVPARSGPEAPAVRDALAAGEALREALREYRSRFGAAARELAADAPSAEGSAGRGRGDAEGVGPAGAPGAAPGFEALRSDWERTVAAFRETVERVGTAHKTLARER